MAKNPWVRIVYLYTFSLLGLVLMIIGGVQLLNLGLKAFVFTQADQQNVYPIQPPLLAVDTKGENVLANIGQCADNKNLSEEQKTEITNWLNDYDNWQKSNQTANYVKQDRQRTAAQSIALIIIGLPLYIFHWALIKKENKKQEEII